MSISKLIYLKDKGFTLLELIITLSIACIILIPLTSILTLSIRSCSVGEVRDELALSGRYAIEFIKGEVRNADIIVSEDRIENLNCENNIGFVLVTEDKEKDKDAYNYVTYYIKNNILYRFACKGDREKYLYLKKPAGVNKICDFFSSFEDSGLNLDGVITLNFLLKSSQNSKWEENLNLTTDIYIRCGIDY